MSEQTRPQPHDKVRFTVEGEALTVGTGGWMKLSVGAMPGQPNGGELALPLGGDGITVEVVERADDPSQELVGAVRRSRRGTVAVRDREGGPWPWHAVYGRDDDENDSLSDENVTGWERLAPMAGSPAAEAEKPAENSHENHCKDLAEAIYASHIYPWEDLLLTARRYAVHAMRDEIAADGDNEAIEMGQYYVEKARQRQAQREPRVFRSDGPEPPEDVKALEWLQFDSAHNGTPYLKRCPVGTRLWVWVGSPDDEPDSWGGIVWPPNPDYYPGDFREVI